MDFKNCTEPGCGFHMPVTYPFSKCPWHLAPGRSAGEKALVVAGALMVFAAGWGIAKGIEAIRTRRRREEIVQGQQAWWEGGAAARSQKKKAVSDSSDDGLPVDHAAGDA